MSTVGLVPWIAAAAASLAATRVRHPVIRRRTRQLEVEGLRHHRDPTDVAPASTIAWADLLDTTARHVRSGLSTSAAFHQALATHPVAGAAITPSARFHSVVRASTNDPDEATVIHTLAVAHSFGGPIASCLQAGVSVLRERATVRADVAVHSAQARLSAQVLTAVPILFSSWGVVFSRSFRTAVATPTGAAAASAGLFLNLVGWLWMRRSIAQVLR